MLQLHFSIHNAGCACAWKAHKALGICFPQPRFPKGTHWGSPTSSGRDLHQDLPFSFGKCWRMRMASSGMSFEQYIQCGICSGTPFRLQVLKEFQMDTSREQHCVIFHFVHSFCESYVSPGLVTHTQINSKIDQT